MHTAYFFNDFQRVHQTFHSETFSSNSVVNVQLCLKKLTVIEVQ